MIFPTGIKGKESSHEKCNGIMDGCQLQGAVMNTCDDSPKDRKGIWLWLIAIQDRETITEFWELSEARKKERNSLHLWVYHSRSVISLATVCYTCTPLSWKPVEQVKVMLSLTKSMLHVSMKGYHKFCTCFKHALRVASWFSHGPIEAIDKARNMKYPNVVLKDVSLNEPVLKTVEHVSANTY